jgi:hypothetical protein
MMNTFGQLQAFHMPSVEMLIIFAFAASLPVMFVIWMRGWLGGVKDEDPDQVLRAQAKADEEHLKQHQSHGHGQSHGHAPANAHGTASSGETRPADRHGSQSHVHV